MCGSTTQMAQYAQWPTPIARGPATVACPLAVCQRIVQLSRNTSGSLNHHHLCEKLIGDTFMLPFE